MNNSIEIIGVDHGWSQMKTSNYNAGKQRVCGAFEAGEYRQLQDGRGYRSVGCTAPLRNQQSVRYGTVKVR